MSAEQITIVRIINPFDPKQRALESLAWEEGKTMQDYFPLIPAREDVVASVNGKVVQREDFATITLSKDDYVVVCPVPTGGGDDKSIFRIVAMLAIAVFAQPLAVSLLGETLAAQTIFGSLTYGAAMAAGISMVGGMLVNALLPIKPPDTHRGASDLSSSPTYGIDGAKNISAEGVVVPVPYGTFRYGGNVLATYIENINDTQILYMLFNAGEGPIGSITDIQINDQPISSFTDVEYQVRTGTESQERIAWFDDTITPNTINANLTTSYTNYTTSGPVDKLRFDFVCPSGLFGVDLNSGASYAVGVDLVIEYRKQGDTEWISLGDLSSVVSYSYTNQWYSFPNYDSETGAYLGEVQYTPTGSEFLVGDVWYIWRDISEAQQEQVAVGQRVQVATNTSGITITDANRSTVRRSFATPQLLQGVYETRVKRVTAQSVESNIVDAVYLSDINEIIIDDVNYVHTALLGLKIKLTDQLSSIPKVTYLVTGRVVRLWDPVAKQWKQGTTANPAWILLDMMTSARYGAGMPDSRFDMEAFKTWAQHCIDTGLNFNGVFDQGLTLWDAVMYVCRVGRAQPINVGTRYTIAIEKATSPTMMFTVGNIIQGSFKETWLPMAERSNEIEVTFFDKNDDYKQRTVRVYDPTSISEGKPPRSSNITLYGVDNIDQAYKEGQLQLNLNRYILQTCEFQAPYEAIGCTVGDMIYVQHDMPQWGFGGRLKAGSTTTVINLDREVTMQTGTSYKFLVHYDSIQRFSGTITNIAGNSITLSGYDGSSNVKRLQASGKDVGILSVWTAAGPIYGVIVDDATGISNGAAYTLHDTDVLEERDVVNPNDTVSTITLQSALPSAPAQFRNWMFGAVNKVKKPFRVKAVSGGSEQTRTISAIEYNATVYDMSGVVVPTMNYSSLATAVDHVTIDSVGEELFYMGATIRTRVTVYFHSDQETYRKSRVLVSRNGGPYQEVGSGYDRVSTEAEDGSTLKFKVVAMDVVGASAPDSSAPTTTHVVVGKAAPPSDITNFVGNVVVDGVDLTWNPCTDIDFDHYEVRVGASWAAGTAIYTGKNTKYHDGMRATASYTYWVKAVDTTGNYSTNAASTTESVGAVGTPTVSNAVFHNALKLTWSKVTSDFTLAGYEIRYGASWETGVLVNKITDNEAIITIDWTGSRTFWVAGYDTFGNYGTAGSSVSNITVASAPTVSGGISGQNYYLNWTIPASSLDIVEYEIRHGTDWATGTSIAKIKTNSFQAHAAWGGARTFWVAAIDRAGNVGSAGSYQITITVPSTPSPSNAFEGPDYHLSWNDVTQTLPILEYEIRYGANWATGTFVAKVKSTSYIAPVLWQGGRTFWVKAYDSGGNQSSEGSVVVTVNVPATPSPSGSFDGPNYVLTWGDAKTTLPIEEYEIRHGFSFDAGVSLGTTKATTFTAPAYWEGDRTFWVKAKDTAGNLGTAGSTILNVNVPDAPVVQAGFQDINFVLTWNEPLSSLPIKEYELRFGSDWATSTLIGRYKALSYSAPASWVGNRTFWVLPIDSGDNEGDYGFVVATVNAPSAPVPANSFQGTNYILTWTQPAATLPIKEYEIRHGSVWASATIVGRTKGTVFSAPVNWLGERTFWIHAIDAAANEGAAGSIATEVLAPSAPSVQGAFSEANYVLTWNQPSATLPVVEYEVRHGADWASGTPVGKYKVTTLTEQAIWSGSRNFWVSAIDFNGNVGAAGNVTLNITPPGPPVLSQQVVDNNVLLTWTKPAATLPIESYLVKKGDIWSTATPLGTLSGLFSAIFERDAGTYTYWVAAYDTAGNEGSPVSLAATVTQPPDYVLFQNYPSQMDAPLHTNMWMQQRRYYAVDLNGTTQYGYDTFTAADSLDLDSGPVSIEGWINPDVVNVQQGIVERGIVGSTGLGVYLDSSAKLVVRGSTTMTSVGSVAASEWTHFVAVIDGASSKIYLNRAADAATGTVNPVATNDQLELGRQQTAASTYGNYFNGKITGVRVYSRALNATEAAEHGAGIFKNEANLVAAWDFDEGQGPDINDDSDYYNTLHLVSSPSFVETTLDGQMDIAAKDKFWFPIKPNETWQEHFDNNAWTSMQDAITAGYDYYPFPAPTSAQYVEYIDYGAQLPATIITLAMTKLDEILGAGYTVTPTISYKLNDGDPWTVREGSWTTYATNFRYAKLQVDIAATGDKNLVSATDLAIRLDMKLKSDQGTVTTVAGGAWAQGNLLDEDSYGWEAGMTLPISGWTLNGQASENAIVDLAGPSGSTEAVWACVNNDAAADADGGFDTSYKSIDHTKSYIFAVFVRTTSNNGETYLGMHSNAASDTGVLGGGTTTNPHFINGVDLPATNTWYLLIGFLHGSGYGGADLGIAGIYDMNGTKQADGSEFKLLSDSTGILHRCYHNNNSTDTGQTVQYMTRPYIAECASADATAKIAYLIQCAKAIGGHFRFNTTFVDVTSITVTPNNNSAAQIPIYDFVDVPYPKGANTFIYNTSGTLIAAEASWNVRGLNG